MAPRRVCLGGPKLGTVAAVMASLLLLACSASGAGPSSTSPGKAAIAQVAQKVKRMTGARSYSITGCVGGGYRVTCSVRWSYKGFSCTERLASYRSGPTTKVRKNSQVRCR